MAIDLSLRLFYYYILINVLSIRKVKSERLSRISETYQKRRKGLRKICKPFVFTQILRNKKQIRIRAVKIINLLFIS